MVSWEQDDLAMMGRWDETNVWNMALWREWRWPRLTALVSPLGVMAWCCSSGRMDILPGSESNKVQVPF